MHFPGIRLVEQTEQKVRRFESVFKKKEKTSDCNSRALLLLKAPTKNSHFLSLKSNDRIFFPKKAVPFTAQENKLFSYFK